MNDNKFNEMQARLYKFLDDVKNHPCCVDKCEKQASGVGDGNYYCDIHFWRAFDNDYPAQEEKPF